MKTFGCNPGADPGVVVAGAAAAFASAASASSNQPTARPSTVRLTAVRKLRRTMRRPGTSRSLSAAGRGGSSQGSWINAGRLSNRRADARVGAAAAQIAGERLIDLGVARLRLLGEQRRRRHDLPRLAVATLRHRLLDPGALQRVRAVRRQAL